MPYATNLPLRDRPRGLGDLAERASGLGSWVVNNTWGLSPPIIEGQPRPYGQTVVQTMYPRSQDPRLLNLHMGPVIPGGTWPTLRRMNNQPVFRTPVDRPGQIQTSLPPGAGGPGLRAGSPGVVEEPSTYGYIPMGVAHAPYELLERGPFGALGQGAPTGMTLAEIERLVTWEWFEHLDPRLLKSVISTAPQHQDVRDKLKAVSAFVRDNVRRLQGYVDRVGASAAEQDSDFTSARNWLAELAQWQYDVQINPDAAQELIQNKAGTWAWLGTLMGQTRTFVDRLQQKQPGIVSRPTPGAPAGAGVPPEAIGTGGVIAGMGIAAYGAYSKNPSLMIAGITLGVLSAAAKKAGI